MKKFKKVSTKKLVMLFSIIAITVLVLNYYVPAANAAPATAAKSASAASTTSAAATKPVSAINTSSGAVTKPTSTVNTSSGAVTKPTSVTSTSSSVQVKPVDTDNNSDEIRKPNYNEVSDIKEEEEIKNVADSKNQATGNIETEDTSKALNTGGVKGKNLSDTMNLEPLSGSLKKLKLNKGSAEILVP